MKLPGIYGGYALIMALFGQTPEGIRFGLLVADVATMILIVLRDKRLFDPNGGRAVFRNVPENVPATIHARPKMGPRQPIGRKETPRQISDSPRGFHPGLGL